jgi:hypothetical protein
MWYVVPKRDISLQLPIYTNRTVVFVYAFRKVVFTSNIPWKEDGAITLCTFTNIQSYIIL